MEKIKSVFSPILSHLFASHKKEKLLEGTLGSKPPRNQDEDTVPLSLACSVFSFLLCHQLTFDQLGPCEALSISKSCSVTLFLPRLSGVKDTHRSSIFSSKSGRREKCSISAWSSISGKKRWGIMNPVTAGTSRYKLATCLSKVKYGTPLITMDALLATWIGWDIKYYIHLFLRCFSRTTRKTKGSIPLRCDIHASETCIYLSFLKK